ncbi:hypothetical protein DFJ77DRAFT_476004 [Powellomyces hirtus]|nr:hypothetical protein DFJ77DRAFT_476004 [Powellomyces hirtus]
MQRPSGSAQDGQPVNSAYHSSIESLVSSLPPAPFLRDLPTWSREQAYGSLKTQLPDRKNILDTLHSHGFSRSSSLRLANNHPDVAIDFASDRSVTDEEEEESLWDALGIMRKHLLECFKREVFRDDEQRRGYIFPNLTVSLLEVFGFDREVAQAFRNWVPDQCWQEESALSWISKLINGYMRVLGGTFPYHAEITDTWREEEACPTYNLTALPGEVSTATGWHDLPTFIQSNPKLQRLLGTPDVDLSQYEIFYHACSATNALPILDDNRALFRQIHVDHDFGMPFATGFYVSPSLKASLEWLSVHTIGDRRQLWGGNGALFVFCVRTADIAGDSTIDGELWKAVVAGCRRGIGHPSMDVPFLRGDQLRTVRSVKIALTLEAATRAAQPHDPPKPQGCVKTLAGAEVFLNGLVGVLYYGPGA